MSVIDIFPTPLYTLEIPEFLEVVKAAAEDAIDPKLADNSNPTIMTGDFTYDERVKPFAQQIIQLGYDILKQQGYKLDHLQTYFQSMWMQKHHKHSNMEQHVHGEGAQLVAFYFLEVPENSSCLILHDPRPGKLQIDLQTADHSELYYSSQQVIVKPNPGTLVVTNAWLPHSFPKNMSDEPMSFVHINIGVQPKQEGVCQGPIIV